jgi:hypothetical protein
VRILQNVLFPVPLEPEHRVESTALPLIVNQKVQQLIRTQEADGAHLLPSMNHSLFGKLAYLPLQNKFIVVGEMSQ